MKVTPTTKTTMSILTKRSCRPLKSCLAITSFKRAIISGTREREVTERLNTENPCTSLDDVLQWSSGGRSIAISFGQQNSSLTVSFISLRVESNRCGKTTPTSVEASGSYGCGRIKSIGPGKTFAWRCWASSFSSGQRFAESSCRPSIRRTCFLSGIARQLTPEVQIE